MAEDVLGVTTKRCTLLKIKSFGRFLANFSHGFQLVPAVVILSAIVADNSETD